ncbi:MAG: DUF2149 domain-containing protein [Planctomycetaceae bacterium]
MLNQQDEDPLTSVANLFDVAMVFAVALLLALVTRYQLTDTDVTLVKNPGEPNMEIIHRDGEKLTHYQLSETSLNGDGERLGTAYRLKSGEVVYVPE